MPDPLWMQPPTLAPKPRHVAKHPPGQEHLSWPWCLPIKDSVGFELEESLKLNHGSGCKLVKYLYNPTVQGQTLGEAQWRFGKATTISKDIKTMVEPGKTAFFMASSLQDEAIRALGFWIDIPPTFFMLPDVRLRVLIGSSTFMFTLQYWDKYAVGHQSLNSKRPISSPQHRFRSRDGQRPHAWHTTRACLAFSTRDYPFWKGLYIFNENDDAMAIQLKGLLTASDRPNPNQSETRQGSGQVIGDVIFLINSRWAEFFDEADLHLRVLSKQCVGESLLPAQQLLYMRELHELSPLWTSARRHLTAIRDLIGQVLQHEISTHNSTHGDRADAYYVKRLQVVEDHIVRCNDAAAQTNNLISLIFNIAALQESRAAVEESKAANAFAGSIRRVTMLTFIYLPLTLASSVMGMNITQITGETTHSQLWMYFAVAVALMAATFGGWYVWSKLMSNIERRVRQRAFRRAAKDKGV